MWPRVCEESVKISDQLIDHDQGRAFVTLKNALVSSPVLAYPIFGLPFCVQTIRASRGWVWSSFRHKMVSNAQSRTRVGYCPRLSVTTRRRKSNIHEKITCCVSGGISLVSCIMSCSNRTKQSVYRTQLMKLSRALKEKRAHHYPRHEKVILLHDNARPHVAVLVKTYLETLK